MVIRHIVASDDENSDTDHFEVIRLCICFVKIIIVSDLPESIFQIQRLTGLCKCVSYMSFKYPQLLSNLIDHASWYI